MAITIRDTDGVSLEYWPISGLVEGEDSEILFFEVDFGSSASGHELRATPDARVKTWAKKTGDPSFQDISDTAYDVSALTGVVEFQTYVELVGPIVGFQRIPISVSVGSSSPAGWEA